MTNPEAIEELEWIYQNGFVNDFNIDGVEKSLDAIRKGIDALDKEEKYKRHDLRKNPNDLPEMYEPVLLEVLRFGAVVAWVGRDYWYIDYDDEFPLCEKGSPRAVAWKYIDLFEEDKNEG